MHPASTASPRERTAGGVGRNEVQGVRPDDEALADASQLLADDALAGLAEHLRVQAGHAADVIDRHRDRADARHPIGVARLAWHALRAGRLVLDQKRRDTAIDTAWNREHPLELIAVGPHPRQRRRIVDVHAGLAEGGGVGHQVVGLHAEVDQASALLERLPPFVLGILLVERDQLDVGAVGERDQRVVGPDGMPAARHHRETEALVIAARDSEVGNGDNDVIDALQHPGSFLLRRTPAPLRSGSAGADRADPTRSAGAPCGRAPRRGTRGAARRIAWGRRPPSSLRRRRR